MPSRPKCKAQDDGAARSTSPRAHDREVFTGITIALRNLAHYRRYRRELAQLHMPHIRVMSIAKSVVRRLLGMEV